MKNGIIISVVLLIVLAACSPEVSTTLAPLETPPSPEVPQPAIITSEDLSDSPRITQTSTADAEPTPGQTLTVAPMHEFGEAARVFGVQITFAQPGETELIAQAGTLWTRRDVLWSAIEPVHGERNWNPGYEQALISTANLGIETILILGATPQWALMHGFRCGVVAEDRLDELAAFAYDLVRHYSAPPFNIKNWEMWNEPDAAGFMGCWGDPSDMKYYGGYTYGQMLKAVYPAMKAADPQAQVLVGGLLLDCDPNNPPANRTCVESHFLRGILESGAGDSFDGVAFHGYDYYYSLGAYGNSNWGSSSTTTGPVSIAKAHYLQAILEEYGQGHKYLANTEAGIFYGPYPSDATILCAEDASPDVQITKAYYVVQSYTVAAAEGWLCNIWYSAFGVRCSGFIETDLTPLPAYYAYQYTQQKLDHAHFVRQITEFPGVKGYEFTVSGERLWVLWSLDGSPHTISLEQMPVSITHIGEDGKPFDEPNTTSPTIDLSPRFIEP